MNNAMQNSGHKKHRQIETHVRASMLYQRQNKIIHKAFSALGLPYSENKNYWQDLFRDIAGKPVAGLSAMTLGRRRDLIAHLKKQNAAQINSFVPQSLLKWKKGDPDIQAAIPRFSKHGFPKRPSKSCFSDIDKGKMLKKIEALLAEAKRPWSYVHGMAKRMAKVERIEWCTPKQMHDIVSALMKDALRHGRRIT